jgi:phenylacetate-CoA ligase
MLAPSVRRTLEQDYGIDTRQAYGVTEPGGAIAYECEQKSGMHLMDDYAVEIIDSRTGKQLPPGEIGEIVVTPLHNPAWGLIRFGTGDLSSVTTGPCPCGRTACKLTGILGRAGDAIKVRGMFVVARQAEEAIAGQGAVSRFQLVVARPAGRDELILKAELRPGVSADDALARDLNDRFQNACRVRIDRVEFIPPDTLPDKYQKLLDQRKWD